MIDPAQLYVNRIVRVRFTPRHKHNGRPLRNSVKRNVGLEENAFVAWRCDKDDGYPGEWALMAYPPHAADLFGATWVASGDLTLVEAR
jgi:hypothetical protein